MKKSSIFIIFNYTTGFLAQIKSGSSEIETLPSEEYLCETFDKIDWNDQVKRNIEDRGYKNPTPVQQWFVEINYKKSFDISRCLKSYLYSVLRIISEGRDVMACAQTGSGKTAAFLLPIINELLKLDKEVLDRNFDRSEKWVAHPLACIFAPTRELAVQISKA